MDSALDEIIKSNSFTKTKNDLLLTNEEISILKRYDIDYESSTSLKEILFKIENTINDLIDEDIEDLDYIASTIAERDYYQNSNK